MIGIVVAVVVASASAAVAAVLVRLRHEIPNLIEALDRLGRDLQPAVVRVRSAADEARARTPER